MSAFTQRREVDASVGRLPSTAVFVDGDDRIDPLVEATKDLLAERSIPIAVRNVSGRRRCGMAASWSTDFTTPRPGELSSNYQD
jgi:hypothetical protein